MLSEKENEREKEKGKRKNRRRRNLVKIFPHDVNFNQAPLIKISRGQEYPASAAESRDGEEFMVDNSFPAYPRPISV